MSRSYCAEYDEDWQRKKSWLIRSHFHDVPVLSPIREESENEDPSVRPYSPLPPLIIEREPPNYKHDEPEEFYAKLLKKTKKLYKKLFIDNLDVTNVDFNVKSSSENVSDDNCNENDDIRFIRRISEESIKEDDSYASIEEEIETSTEGEVIGEERSEDSDSSDNEAETRETEDIVMSNEELGVDVDTTVSDDGPRHMQLTVEAQVHIDAAQESVIEKLTEPHKDADKEFCDEILEDRIGPNQTRNTQVLVSVAKNSVRTSRNYVNPIKRVVMPGARLTEAHTYHRQETDEEMSEEWENIADSNQSTKIQVYVAEPTDEDISEELEDNGHPETDLSSSENPKTPDIMRTPRAKASVESIPVTRRTDSDTFVKNTAFHLENRKTISPPLNDNEVSIYGAENAEEITTGLSIHERSSSSLNDKEYDERLSIGYRRTSLSQGDKDENSISDNETELLLERQKISSTQNYTEDNESNVSLSRSAEEIHSALYFEQDDASNASQRETGEEIDNVLDSQTTEHEDTVISKERQKTLSQGNAEKDDENYAFEHEIAEEVDTASYVGNQESLLSENDGKKNDSEHEITEEAYRTLSTEHRQTIQSDNDENATELHPAKDVDKIITSIVNENEKSSNTTLSRKRKFKDVSVQTEKRIIYKEVSVQVEELRVFKHVSVQTIGICDDLFIGIPLKVFRLGSNAHVEDRFTI